MRKVKEKGQGSLIASVLHAASLCDRAEQSVKNARDCSCALQHLSDLSYSSTCTSLRRSKASVWHSS